MIEYIRTPAAAGKHGKNEGRNQSDNLRYRFMRSYLFIIDQSSHTDYTYKTTTRVRIE